MTGRTFVALTFGLLTAVVTSSCGGEGTDSASAPLSSPTASPGPTTMPPLTRSADLDVATVIDLATVSPLSTIFGADTGDHRSDLPPLVSGDFNADGIDDILVGARFGDGPGNERKDAGEVYVIFGSPDLPSSIDVAAGEQAMTVWGAIPGDNFGFSAAAGDLNGDGIDDMIIGALTGSPLEDPGAGVGAVYLIFGRPELPQTLDIAANEQHLNIRGLYPAQFCIDELGRPASLRRPAEYAHRRPEN